jgi:hypothetical protein
VALRRYLTDDTFIHCVFARNVATRGEFSFTAGAPVYGDTSPLWVLLLALAGAAGGDYLLAAKVLAATAGLALVFVVYAWCRRLAFPGGVAATAAVCVAVEASVARWASSGMETSLATLSMVGALLLLESAASSSLWGASGLGLLLGAATLIRPEASLLAVLIAVVVVGRTCRRRTFGERSASGATVQARRGQTLAAPEHAAPEVARPAGAASGVWKRAAPRTETNGSTQSARDGGKRRRSGWRLFLFGGAYAFVVLPWLVYALHSFGTLTPTTSAAKSSGLVAVPSQIAGDLVREARILAATEAPSLAALGLCCILPATRRRLLGQSRASLRVGLVWAAGVLLAYAVLGYEIVSRYLVPILPLLVVAGVGAAWVLGERIGRPGSLLVLFTAGFLALNAFVTVRITRPQVLSFSLGLHRSLIPAARWFSAHTAPGSVIALYDIGAVGYYSERPVLDLGGLVTPAMTALRRRATDEEILARGDYFSLGDPNYLFVRGAGSDTLDAHAVRGHRFRRVFAVEMPNLGVTRPAPVTYTVYKVERDATSPSSPRAR